MNRAVLRKDPVSPWTYLDGLLGVMMALHVSRSAESTRAMPTWEHGHLTNYRIFPHEDFDDVKFRAEVMADAYALIAIFPFGS